MMVRGFLQTPVPSELAYSPAGVAKSIAEGLAKRGHEVTFFGPEGTSLQTDIETLGLRPLAKTTAELDEIVSTTDLFSDYQPSLFDARFAREMLERAKKKEFDCVVFNHFESALPLAKLFPTVPIVYILHDYIDEPRRRAIEMYDSPNQYFVSISNNQRRDAADLRYIKTIYNGINTDDFSFGQSAEDYLMFSGRITPTKGVKEAVQAAIQSGRRLLIAGNLSKQDFWYFDEHIKPFLNDRILYLGLLDKAQLVKYYQKAAALLMPIQWEEPFGLAMAEANACGTPVIAFNRGAAPEVIVNNKTGYIVDNSAEMIMAIQKIDKLKRKDCREHVLRHFTEAMMVDGYENTLMQVIASHASAKKTPQQPTRSSLIANKIKKISKQLIGVPDKK